MVLAMPVIVTNVTVCLFGQAWLQPLSYPPVIPKASEWRGRRGARPRNV